MSINRAAADELLSTTRAVRKRLDLTREVPREVLVECIDLCQQAPTGSNAQGWRWVVVQDAEKRAALAEIYREGGGPYLEQAREAADPNSQSQTRRVYDSALYLLDHLHEVPVHVIPCLSGRLPESVSPTQAAGFFASIYPAVWSFQLALRARGLGTVLTTLHLLHERKAAELLGIPDDVTQCGLLPVAYTLGQDFKPAKRPDPETIIHWDSW